MTEVSFPKNEVNMSVAEGSLCGFEGHLLYLSQGLKNNQRERKI